jgi:hypothetical protein
MPEMGMDEGAAVKESLSGCDQYSILDLTVGMGFPLGFLSFRGDSSEDFSRLAEGLSS